MYSHTFFSKVQDPPWPMELVTSLHGDTVAVVNSITNFRLPRRVIFRTWVTRDLRHALDGYLPSLLSTLLMEKQLKQWNTQHSRLRVCQLTGSKERNSQSYHVSKRSKRRRPSFAKKSTGSGQCCYYTALLSSEDLLDRVETLRGLTGQPFLLISKI